MWLDENIVHLSFAWWYLVNIQFPVCSLARSWLLFLYCSSCGYSVYQTTSVLAYIYIPHIYIYIYIHTINITYNVCGSFTVLMLRLSHTYFWYMSTSWLNKAEIQCGLDACKYCPVVTIVDKNDDRQCSYLWGVLEWVHC